jgi:3',5'-cyclic AMP phosphodiesterase CpdA
MIHVSDLHFGLPFTEGPRKELLGEVAREIALSPGNTYLLVTGDITNSGQPGEYDDARQALQKLGVPLLLAPGNHDYGEVGNFPDPGAPARFDKFARDLNVKQCYAPRLPVVDRLPDEAHAEVVAVGLISCGEQEDLVAIAEGDVFSRGKIGTEQLNRLGAELSKVPPGTPKLVYLHHKPLECPGLGWFVELRDATKLRKVVEQHGVDVVAFGHTGKEVGPEDPSPCNILAVRGKGSQTIQFVNANECKEQKRFNEIYFDGSSVVVNTVDYSQVKRETALPQHATGN